MRCLNCFRSTKSCFCQSIISFPTNSEFIILLHPKEAKKQRVGTGRISNLFLKESKIIIGEEFSDNSQVNNLLKSPVYFPVMLYPGEKSHDISQYPISLPMDKKLLIFILDGTWPCAKSMMRRSLNLQKLPRISFKITQLSRFVIKQQPAKYCLSTIESIYYLLTELEKCGLENLNNKHLALLTALDQMVNFQLKCINDPNLIGYRRQPTGSTRIKKESKKWIHRRICFEEKGSI